MTGCLLRPLNFMLIQKFCLDTKLSHENIIRSGKSLTKINYPKLLLNPFNSQNLFAVYGMEIYVWELDDIAMIYLKVCLWH